MLQASVRMSTRGSSPTIVEIPAPANGSRYGEARDQLAA